MCLWYGLLYVTCDGIEEHAKIRVSTIAPEYAKISSTLRCFRNAMFHVQPGYWSGKLMRVIEDGDTPTAIRAIHTSVGAWLEKELKPIANRT